MKGNGHLTVISTLASVGALGPLGLGCSTQSPAGQGADAATDSSSASGSDGSTSGSSSGGGSSSSSSSSGFSPASSSSGSGSSGGTPLRWYYTCGDPVCHAPEPDAGGLTDDAGAPCPAVGSTCSAAGSYCGTSNPYFNCGATEQCAASDPTMILTGCPVH